MDHHGRRRKLVDQPTGQTIPTDDSDRDSDTAVVTDSGDCDTTYDTAGGRQQTAAAGALSTLYLRPLDSRADSSIIVSIGVACLCLHSFPCFLPTPISNKYGCPSLHDGDTTKGLQ